MATPGESFKLAPATRRDTQERRTRRYEPTPVYELADKLKREGIDLHTRHGPWRPVRRLLRRPGRNAEGISVVTNEWWRSRWTPPEHAADLSGLLNCAGLDSLDPVPNLRPPDQDLAHE